MFLEKLQPFLISSLLVIRRTLVLLTYVFIGCQFYTVSQKSSHL